MNASLKRSRVQLPCAAVLHMNIEGPVERRQQFMRSEGKQRKRAVGVHGQAHAVAPGENS